jgi:hypothetical protein
MNLEGSVSGGTIPHNMGRRKSFHTGSLETAKGFANHTSLHRADVRWRRPNTAGQGEVVAIKPVDEYIRGRSA